MIVSPEFKKEITTCRNEKSELQKHFFLRKKKKSFNKVLRIKENR